MAKRVFITATNTDIGKTHASTLLLKEFASQGLKVGVFKPIETGVETHPLDGKKLFELACELNPDFAALDLDTIVPYQFKLPAAPMVAKKSSHIDMNYILQKLEEIEQYCDIVLIEGAGGLLVPIDENLFMVNLINIFDASVLLVTSSKLGSINDTLLSQHLLQYYKTPYTWAINLHLDKESFHEVTAPFYRDGYLTLQDDIKTIANRL